MLYHSFLQRQRQQPSCQKGLQLMVQSMVQRLQNQLRKGAGQCQAIELQNQEKVQDSAKPLGRLIYLFCFVKLENYEKTLKYIFIIYLITYTVVLDEL